MWMVIIPMKSKELFKHTFVEQHKMGLIISMLAVLCIGGSLGMAAIGIVADPTGGPMLSTSINLVVGFLVWFLSFGLVTGTHDHLQNKRDQRVNLFMGYHDWTKFVELSLKYLGYTTKVLDENDKTRRNFIILNDEHLVYASRHELSLGDLDEACKIAKDMDKSLTVISKHEGVTSDASVVAKRAGIIIHRYNELYNVLDTTIKNKGGEPIRECFCT